MGRIIIEISKHFYNLWQERKAFKTFNTLLERQVRNPAGLIFQPKNGSLFNQYEILVQKGCLARDLPGYYRLAGR